MALTRRFLKDLGIEPEQIEKIIGEHSETVTALKDKIDTLETETAEYKPKAEKLDGLQAEYDKLKAQTEDNSEYKALREEFDKYKADVEARDLRTKKSDKVKAVLKDIGIPERHYEKILKYSDIDKIELDDAGEIKEIAELKKNLETDWSDHIDHTEERGAQTSTPPAAAGAVDLSQLDMASYIAERKKQKG